MAPPLVGRAKDVQARLQACLAAVQTDDDVKAQLSKLQECGQMLLELAGSSLSSSAAVEPFAKDDEKEGFRVDFVLECKCQKDGPRCWMHERDDPPCKHCGRAWFQSPCRCQTPPPPSPPHTPPYYTTTSPSSSSSLSVPLSACPTTPGRLCGYDCGCE